MSIVCNGSSETLAYQSENCAVQCAETGKSSVVGANTLTFRSYRVYPMARRVLKDGREIALGGRAFDLLVVLLRARGRLVSQEEIIRHVWPSTTVDDSNVRFQMAVLRKALSEDRDVVRTVPGRGYLITDDCDLAATWPIDARATSDESAAVLQAGPKKRRAERLHDSVPPTTLVSAKNDTTAPSTADVNGLIRRLEPSLLTRIEVSSPSAVAENNSGELEQRLADLEQENVWLKLAIASLTLRRLAQILPQDLASGL